MSHPARDADSRSRTPHDARQPDRVRVHLDDRPDRRHSPLHEDPPRRLVRLSASARFAPPRPLDGRNVDLLHRHHRLESSLRLGATNGKRLRQRARGDLPGEAPTLLAPTALTFLAPIADDRVPVAVRLFLIVRRDLEGKGLAVLELRAAVETETRNAQNGELHRQHIALLAARVVTGRLVNGGHFTIRKGGGVEARRLMSVLVEPEADRVLWLHVRVLLVLHQGERRGLRVERIGRIRQYKPNLTCAEPTSNKEYWARRAEPITCLLLSS